MIAAVVIVIALPVALVIGGRWIVDADTRRRTHATYRKMVALDQLRGYDREGDADRRAAEYVRRGGRP